MKVPGCFALTIVSLVACTLPADQPATPRLDTDVDAQDLAVVVEHEVRDLMAAIAASLAEDGPNGWLGHFENSERFFMASDGVLVFPDLETATASVTGFDNTIERMGIEWIDVGVDVLSGTEAMVRSAYREFFVATDGSETSFGGYFTGLAVKSAGVWHLRNLHWSSPVPGN